MEEKKKSKNNNNKIVIAVALCLIALIAAILSILFSRKETRTTADTTESSVGALYCDSMDPEDPFFTAANVIRASHQLKIIFADSKPDKLTYNYYGTFNAEGVADTARSVLHADYNNYLGANGVDQEILHPTFDYDGSKVKVNLFAEIGSDLNVVTAKLFFLSHEDVNNIKKYTNEDLTKIYESKGFSCTFKE